MTASFYSYHDTSSSGGICFTMNSFFGDAETGVQMNLSFWNVPSSCELAHNNNAASIPVLYYKTNSTPLQYHLSVVFCLFSIGTCNSKNIILGNFTAEWTWDKINGKGQFACTLVPLIDLC